MNSINNKFPIKSLNVALEPRESISSPTSVIWNSWVPSKESIFIWEASWGKGVDPKLALEKRVVFDQ